MDKKENKVNRKEYHGSERKSVKKEKKLKRNMIKWT